MITSAAVTGTRAPAGDMTPNPLKYSSNGTSAREEISRERPDSRRSAISHFTRSSVRSAASKSRPASHTLASAINSNCAAADRGRYPRATNSKLNPAASAANGPVIPNLLIITISHLVEAKRESLGQQP
jgi:hypothetical protein